RCTSITRAHRESNPFSGVYGRWHSPGNRGRVQAMYAECRSVRAHAPPAWAMLGGVEGRMDVERRNIIVLACGDGGTDQILRAVFGSGRSSATPAAMAREQPVVLVPVAKRIEA